MTTLGVGFCTVSPEVTRDTITNWRRGGSMPDWAIERLALWLQARAEAMLIGASRLREEAPRDRRRFNGGRVPHKRRAERLANEGAGLDRELNAPIPKPNDPLDTRSECRRYVEERLGRVQMGQDRQRSSKASSACFSMTASNSWACCRSRLGEPAELEQAEA
jgi:hypothetical protein